MPVHNALPHLDAAVESVLRQTFRHFEFVILDDASTDGSVERLRHWAAVDPRIRLIEISKNLGPALSSERVARAAVAPIVARMDADDIAHPDRLQKQLQVLRQRPEVGLVGSLSETIDTVGRTIRGAEHWRLLLPASIPPMNHGTIMYRQAAFELAGGYRKECEFWEDYDLIVRMARVTKIVVLPEALYKYRHSPVSTRLASEQDRVEEAVDLMYRSRARIDSGGGYDDLLGAPRNARKKLDPRVYVSLGSIALWAGDRPHVLRRLIRRGDLSADFKTLSALTWTLWAWLQPHSLRFFIRFLLLVRQLRAWALVPKNEPVPWPAESLRPERSPVAVPAE